MPTVVAEYVLEQFDDEDSSVSCNNKTNVDSRQCHSQSDAAAADAVCMETSFGVESNEPRTHIFHNTQSEDQLNTHLSPGCLSEIFACYSRPFQRDGRLAEHRWRPLFNTAKFG